MASIVEFKISGLAGRKKIVHYTLNPEINIFWGLNGTGKTSLLKILHSALDDDGSTLLLVPFTSAEVTIKDEHMGLIKRTLVKKDQDADAERALLSISSHGEFGRAEAEHIMERQLSLFHNASKLLWTTSWNKNTSGNYPLVSPLSHRYLPISRISDPRRNRQLRRPTPDSIDEDIFDQLFAQQIQDIWRDYSNAALIRIRQAQEKGLAEVLSITLSQREDDTDHKTTQLDETEAYAIAKAFLQSQRFKTSLPNLSDFTNKYQQSGTVRKVVVEFSKVQREVDKAQEPEHRIQELVAALYAGGKHVDFSRRALEVRAGKKTIPLESLSSGEKQLLRIFVETASAHKDCILIDEPELSMHVDWQHKLVESMRIVNPEVQIILATHSPEVMADIDDGSIFQL